MGIWETIKKYAMVAGGLVVGLLYLLLRIEGKKRADAEAKLVSAEHDKTDAVLASKQEAAHAEIEKAMAEAEVAKGRKLTPEEMEEFLKGL